MSTETSFVGAGFNIENPVDCICPNREKLGCQGKMIDINNDEWVCDTCFFVFKQGNGSFGFVPLPYCPQGG